MGTPKWKISKNIFSPGKLKKCAILLHIFLIFLGLPRYTNMGVEYAYPDPTNTLVVLKTISNVFYAHFVHTMGAPEHATKSS